MDQVIPNCGIGAEDSANVLAIFATWLLRDLIDERIKCPGTVFYERLGGFTLSFHGLLTN